MATKFKVGDRVETNEYWGRDSGKSCGDGPDLLKKYPVGLKGTVIMQGTFDRPSPTVQLDNGSIERFQERYLNLTLRAPVEKLRFSEVDVNNAGSGVTANKLREIAESGRYGGVLGGEETEKAAQAILKLRKERDEARQALIVQFDQERLRNKYVLYRGPGGDSTRTPSKTE